MSIDEIFSTILSHMLKGIMLHEQLMNCYLFLGLKGYSKCHEYHFLSESKAHAKLCRYVLTHHDRLISLGKIEDPGLIPETWYAARRDDVSKQSRKEAILASLKSWADWEEGTKSLYSEAYKNLITIGEVASANFLLGYILDVDKELAYAQEELIEKTATGFDIVSILEEQNAVEKAFKKKIRTIK